MTPSPEVIKQMKQMVGIAAAQRVKSGMVVGLGTGSTAAFMIEELGSLLASGALTDIIGIPTSFESIVLGKKYGVPIRSLDDVSKIDIAIDGADEVDPRKNLIKGGGAAHTREKVVDTIADTFIVVVDSSKLVDKLGSTFAVPVEVIPMAIAPVTRAIEKLGGVPALRMGVRKAGPVITDQGNMVIDVRFADIPDPLGLEQALNNIPGVLENGLFVNVTDVVLVGEVKDGVPLVREF
ncbi:ribose-5-phosphate isomerase [Synechococcus sp. PCC 7502]|uniref:ribose-5-phosphate isomerase RpiA n=1 Tax=Synechococcus sp. PCC 7502 TaxID=1173263 RepID=UPI00029F93F8|nr:ribose-5-phosphate isomerase RpiA [Synechococcus sp. PCC 7502]AFY72764.1 ribose-5-phosphate isomerase [Synechococcus sp. PCC 7502]